MNTVLTAGGEPAVGAYVIPRAGDRESAAEAAEAVRTAGADFVVAAMAGPERSAHASTNQSVDLAAACQRRAGVPAVAAVTTWNRTIMTLQAHLLGGHARGVTRVVCGTGSPPPTGDHPRVDGRWAVDAVGLIELLRGLNDGIDHHGLRLDGATRFEIGARVDTTFAEPAAERRTIRRQLAAGAHFLITSPVYAASGLDALLELVDGAVPVLVTVHPLRSLEEAELLHRELPGDRLPERVVRRMAAAGNDPQPAGVEIALQIAQAYAGVTRGVVVSGAEHPAVISQVRAAVSHPIGS
jgi:homocysteine S-methyltransferase